MFIQKNKQNNEKQSTIRSVENIRFVDKSIWSTYVIIPLLRAVDVIILLLLAVDVIVPLLLAIDVIVLLLLAIGQINQ